VRGCGDDIHTVLRQLCLKFRVLHLLILSRGHYQKSLLQYVQHKPYDLCYLVHLSDKLVDVGFSVAKVTTLYIVLEFPSSPSTRGVRELEWPQEVRGLEDFLRTKEKKQRVDVHLFEVRSSGGNFVNKILDAKNIELSQSFFDNGIV